MDEIGTTDIADFALPGSGTIKLSEIKGEFNKGNNLTAYYGAASGIPSSGTIKVTDFYGKSAGGGTVGPSGSYGTGVKHYQTTDPDNIGAPQFTYFNHYWCSGTGSGNPVAWGNEAGVYCYDKRDYDSCSARRVSVKGNSKDMSNYYPYLSIGPTSGPADYRKFSGSWTSGTGNNYFLIGTSGPVFSITSTIFSNQSAAEYLWSIMQQGKPFYIGVSNSAREALIIDGEEHEFTLYEEEEE